MSHLDTALRRAIADLDPSDRDGRRAAFGHVRASMMRLLALYEPPLRDAEIQGKLDELDALIEAIDAEIAQPLSPPAPLQAEGRSDAVEAEFLNAQELDAQELDAQEPGTQEPGTQELDAQEDEAPDLEDPDAALDLSAFESGQEDADDDMDKAPIAPANGFDRRLTIAVVLVSIVGAAAFVALSPSGRSPPAAPTLSAIKAPDIAPQQADGAVASAAPAPTESDAASTAAAPPPSADTGSPTPAASNQAASDTSAAAPPSVSATSSGPASAETAAASATLVAPPPSASTNAPQADPRMSGSIILFDGHDPKAFDTTPDNPVRFGDAATGSYVRISSSPTSNGARLRIGPGVYQRLAGQTIRIAVMARAASENPAATIRMAYLSGRVLSPWSEHTLGPDYQPLIMSWTMPADRAGKQDDALLIEPGIPGDKTAVDIRSVTIDILPAKVSGRN